MTGKNAMLCSHRALLSACVLIAAGCAPSTRAQSATPSPAGGLAAVTTVPGSSAADMPKRAEAMHGAVTSANALASEAGVEILRAGGNAVDAAVATAFAIGVVEPQMSGLGGSGSMLIWRQDEAQPYYLDFYAMQNAASFRGRTVTDAPGLRIVGIPGEVAGLLEAHRRFGSLPLARVVAPAIRIAEEGFPVGQILAQFIRGDSAKLHRYPAGRDQMWPGGTALAPGDIYRNPALAATLRAIAERGRAGFDEGAAGRALVAALNDGGHPATLDDVSGFEPQWKRPLCIEYHGRIVLSAPPPQTGAQVLHALRLLEPFDLRSLGLPTRSARAFDVIVSALRVAQADNRGTNDDPRWRAVSAAGRVSPAFAAERSTLVGRGTAPASIETADASAHEDAAPDAACAALRPWPIDSPRLPREGSRLDALDKARSTHAVATASTAEVAWSAPSPDMQLAETPSAGETTHMSVVDAAGNAVALTQTNSTIFGSGAWVEGFFLNDSGYLFRTEQSTTGGSSPWRTRTSTIAPTIVLEDGRVRLVTGAPGSGRIPTEIVQTMVYVLDYGMDPIDALRMPRIFPSAVNSRVQLEHGFTPALLAELRSMGYDPAAESGSYARLYMIVRSGDRWIAVSDPRHDGEPRGY